MYKTVHNYKINSSPAGFINNFSTVKKKYESTKLFPF